MSNSSLMRVLVPLVLAAGSLQAQATTAASTGWDPQQILRTERYVRPPARIEQILTTPRVDISFTNQSPDQRWFLRATGVDRSDISIYGAPHVWLGGLVVDNRANRARAVTTSTRTGLTLVDARTGSTRVIETPRGASITAPTW